MVRRSTPLDAAPELLAENDADGGGNDLSPD
jgi:hypothetical protein